MSFQGKNLVGCVLGFEIRDVWSPRLKAMATWVELVLLEEVRCLQSALLVTKHSME